MKHVNTGASSHSNTGYINHTDTYSNHTNVYANHTNSYGNHQNYHYYDYYYDHLTEGEKKKINEEYNPYEDIDFTIYENNQYEVMPISSSSYGAGYYASYYQHTNTGTAHTNTGTGNPLNYKQYSQSGAGTDNYKQYTQSGYSNHANTGYSNHINTNTNKEPQSAFGLDLGTFAYFKDTIKLVWQKAEDNSKCIYCVSGSYGTPQGQTGIFEQGVKKVETPRGISIGYWDVNGVWKGYVSKDTYSDIKLISELQSYYNSIPNGSFVAFSSYDCMFPANEDAITIRNFFSAYGFKKTTMIEGGRSAFAGILKKGSDVLDEKVHRYGINPVNAGMVSAQYIIPNVPSGQNIKYTIEYAFKIVGQTSYGTWTKIGETASLEYLYNLSNHGNGFIKFRILANDGIENAVSYAESKEVRILKYTAPNMSETKIGEIVKPSDFNTIILEMNKLAEATGTTKTSLQITSKDKITKSQALELNSKHSTLDNIVKKGTDTINENEIVKSKNVQNIKNWLKKI